MRAWLPTNASLWEPIAAPVDIEWRPRILDREAWPPNYEGVLTWRKRQLARLRSDPAVLASAKAYYALHPDEFVLHWCDTYDPRRKGARWVPFVLFSRQADLIQFFQELRRDGESGLIEKCRDMGATWGACAYSVASWLFIPDDAIGWGSRKEQLVDKIGDPDSIFEKMRLLLRRIPDVFLPVGFSWRDHATFCKLINPENGSTITGEAGDNIGRGGRKTMYFKDESAHYERPEKIESALGDNTNTQIDISSVNGLGNPFHRRRESGVVWERGAEYEHGQVRVFIMDWRDHPEKTQEWYDTRKAKAIREGLQHVFAQEVDRDYSAAVLNTIIPMEWIRAARDAHLKFPQDQLADNWMAGFDVADDGNDRNAFVKRQGVILRFAKEWGDRDPGKSTRMVLDWLEQDNKEITVEYDNIGIGVNVKSEINRLKDENKLSSKFKFVGWNAGSAVQNPFDRLIADDEETPKNKDFFKNLKAQAWWSLRTRFYKTFCFVTLGVNYPVEEMISIDSKIPLLLQIEKELAQPTSVKSSDLRMMIEKKPDGTRSPNIADAIVMAYYPALEEYATAVVGRQSVGN